MRDNMGLYHAKRTYNGKWVEGCLVVTPQGDAYIISTAETKRDVNVLINQCSLNVDPETVGQFTGLTDRNGKKIFEGDIIERVSDGERAVISWLKYSACFGLSFDGWCFGFDDYDFSPNNFKVIGNIHDNPELMGEEVNE